MCADRCETNESVRPLSIKQEKASAAPSQSVVALFPFNTELCDSDGHELHLILLLFHFPMNYSCVQIPCIRVKLLMSRRLQNTFTPVFGFVCSDTHRTERMDL